MSVLPKKWEKNEVIVEFPVYQSLALVAIVTGQNVKCQ